MKIKITQEHIDSADRALANFTPVCMACKAVWPLARAHTVLGDLYLDGIAIKLPAVVDVFLRDYDEGQLVKPFEFKIKVPLWLRIKLWLNNPSPHTRGTTCNS